MKRISILVSMVTLLLAVNTANAKITCTPKHDNENITWADAKLLLQVASEIGSAWIDGVHVFDVSDKLLQVVNLSPRPESLEDVAKELADCMKQMWVAEDYKITIGGINMWRTEAEVAQSTIVDGGFPTKDEYDTSQDAVKQLVNNDTSFFSRPFDANDQALIDLLNKGCANTGKSAGTGGCIYTRKDLVTDASGQMIPGGEEVYEWRLATPSLMLAIAYRLQTIAAVYPEFLQDPYQTPHIITDTEKELGYSQLTNFQSERSEISNYRAALYRHYNKMVAGLKCGNIDHVCADIHSGYRVGPDSLGAYHVYRDLPLYELKAMIDALYIYGRRGSDPARADLAQNYHRIPSFAEPWNCLEAKKAEFGFSVTLNSCSGSGSQWVYNRTDGTIKNSGSVVDPGSGQCLGVIGGAVNTAPEFQVIASNCTNLGDPNHKLQQWTYDPESHLVLNGTGAALRIHWGNFSVWAAPSSYTPDYLWQADPITPGTLAFSDSMAPGETMYKGQSRVSQNNRFELILQADGNLVLYEKMLMDNPSVERPVARWASGTNGQAVDRVVMQRDGNLIIYPPATRKPTCSPLQLVCDNSIWQSGTSGHPGSHLKVQGDDHAGYVGIYDPKSELVWYRPATPVCGLACTLGP
jgi:hypothetical protein